MLLVFDSVIPAARRLSLPSRHIKVLIVDDAPACRKMHRKLVNNLTGTVDEACDGNECVSMLRSSMESDSPYDLILLDNSMPKMSGPEASKLIRDMGSSVKIIGVTGNARSEDIDLFLSHGADRVILKPLHFDSIKDIVEGKYFYSSWSLSLQHRLVEILTTRRTKYVVSKLMRKTNLLENPGPKMNTP